LAATLGLAITFTLSCHDGGSNDDNPASSNSGAGISSPSSGNSSSSSQGDDIVDGLFTDARDGKKYKTVEIGIQIWMAENLNYHEEWVGITRGNKCYDNIDANCEKYGRMYEWDDAIRVCPDGWHLPSNFEWDALISFVGSDAGKKLKSTSSDWRDGAGTDDYDFGALPGGSLYQGNFENINIHGNWWTSTEYSGDRSVLKAMSPNFNTYNIAKANQYSVRCINGYSSSSAIAYGEVIDSRDNQKYVTVKIGMQTWMAQNLNFAGKGVCYNGLGSNCSKYGRLYTWASTMSAPESYNTELLNATPGYRQGICMVGWHLPSSSEWNALISFVGSDAGKLRARSSEWGDNYGTDIYGFGALPGGSLYQGEFENINIHGNWWTSTENSSDRSVLKAMVPSFVSYERMGKENQWSVRCVED
jgi:uncharacterized protein (TIGR02145 family)